MATVSGNVFGGSLSIVGCKGSVHVFGEGSPGFYAVDPPIPDAQDSKVLIMGVPLRLSEIVQPTATLDDRRILYVFGTAWSELSVSGLMLLGDSSTRGDQLTKVRTWVAENRVSRKKGPVSVSIGTSGLDGYVVGLSLGEANGQNNTQSFSIEMLTADLE